MCLIKGAKIEVTLQIKIYKGFQILDSLLLVRGKTRNFHLDLFLKKEKRERTKGGR